MTLFIHGKEEMKSTCIKFIDRNIFCDFKPHPRLSPVRKRNYPKIKRMKKINTIKRKITSFYQIHMML